MKKLFMFKFSLLTTTPLFAEAIPESFSILNPIQKSLYKLATASKEHESLSLSPQKTQIDPRFLPESLKDLTQNQLADFFKTQQLKATKNT